MAGALARSRPGNGSDARHRRRRRALSPRPGAGLLDPHRGDPLFDRPRRRSGRRPRQADPGRGPTVPDDRGRDQRHRGAAGGLDHDRRRPGEGVDLRRVGARPRQAPRPRAGARVRHRRRRRVAHVLDGPAVRHPARVPVALRHGPRLRDVHIGRRRRRRRVPGRLRGGRGHRRARPAALRLLPRVRRRDFRDDHALRLHPLRCRALDAGRHGPARGNAGTGGPHAPRRPAGGGGDRPSPCRHFPKRPGLHRMVRSARTGLAAPRSPRRAGEAPRRSDDHGHRRRRRHRIRRPSRRHGHAVDGLVRRPRRPGDARRGEDELRRGSAALRNDQDGGAADDRSSGPAAVEGDRRPSPHSRRSVALELRQGPGRNPGGRPRAAGRGRGLGRPAPPRPGNRRLLHVPERRHERPGRREAAEHGLPGVGAERGARGLAQRGRQPADADRRDGRNGQSRGGARRPPRAAATGLAPTCRRPSSRGP